MTLTGSDWMSLVQNVFSPDPGVDRAVAFLLDIPDDVVPDNKDWNHRRAMTSAWVRELRAAKPDLEVLFFVVPNVHRNNADLPETVFLWANDDAPNHVRELESGTILSFGEAFAMASMWVAPTEFSATAPLKLAARKYGNFRAATMPGFHESMIPALRLPWAEINRRVERLRELLDRTTGADLIFHLSDGTTEKLHLDLRHRSAHASGGVLPGNGIAGNLPSGEAYIVPYEGEIPKDPSHSKGVLPVELNGEIVRYRIEENRAVEVLSRGPVSSREAQLIVEEPAYANLAELGLGVLDAFGLSPVGEILLDEKLGLHIAFGRSDHFGGTVGAADFSSPDAVVHIDRVYVPAIQPGIPGVDITLVMADGQDDFPLMRDSIYVLSFGEVP